MLSLFGWLKRLWPRRLQDDDFQDELRAHFAIAKADKMADGADPDSAHYASLREFGNVTLVTEDARKVWTPAWVEAVRDFLSDVRYAVRTLRKDAGFSLTVAAVLTVGIGVNAAVFTMLKGMALTPLPGVEGASRLVNVFATTSAGRTIRLSYPEYQHLRDHDRAFSGLFGSVSASVGLGRGRSSRSIYAELVTGNYFQTLGVGAALGRTLLPSDEIAPGAHPVIVLSDGLWRREFGADPAIVGQTVEINDRPLTVVGVSAGNFHGSILPFDVDAFIPVMMAADLGFSFGSQQTSAAGIFADRHTSMFIPRGFLAPGVSAAAAAAETEALWPAMARQRPLNDPARQLKIVPFWKMPGSAQQTLLPILMVLAATGLLVLLIACANIAGLLLVRGVSRRGEIAVRLALGASRSRVIRLLTIESLVAALPGTVLGVVAAERGTVWLIAYINTIATQQINFNASVDGMVIAFAAILACVCALVFGLTPAITSSRINLVEVLSEASRRTVRGRVRGGLVVAQVAVSLLLLIGAGLTARSFDAALQANPGFEPAHLSAVVIDVKQNGYDAARGRTFYQRLLETARADAGIDSATLAAHIPMNFDDTPASRVSIDGYEPQPGEDLAFLTNTIASDYFRTLRITMLAGRAFEERDDEKSALVAIVNNTLAERFFARRQGGGDGAANAIGRRVRIADGDWRTVVGVVADVKYLRINEAPRPYVYLPFLQNYRPAMVVHTRGAAPGEVLTEQARAAVAAIDPNLPILVASPMTDRIKGSLFLQDFAAIMLFVFGAGGMALAALGIYGLVSYAVKQSTREIGIRMAIGATSGSVLRLFIGRGMRLGAIGAAIGTVSALAATRMFATLLYGVSATDPISFGRGLAMVAGAILIATLVPAWRAARTNPLAALRRE
jgi:predicted permease